MEITAGSSIHHVAHTQPQNSLCKSDSDTSKNVTVNRIIKVTVTDNEVRNQENFRKEALPKSSEITSPNPNVAQIDIKTIVSPLSQVFNLSKPSRFKTSDKLTKVIETCKKLQKLNDKNAQKTKTDNATADLSSAAVKTPVDLEKLPDKNATEMKNDNVTADSVSAAVQVSPSVELNGVTAEKEVSPVISELTVNLERITPADVSVSSKHSENESQSSSLNNNSNLFHSISNCSVSSSKHTSESALKKFLFLFRPSDHEVLVRNKGINMYRCNVCGGMYRQKFSLKRHFLRTHINFHYISKSDISNCKITVPSEFIPQDSNPDSTTIFSSRKKFKSSNAIFFENNEARVMPGLYICHICVGVKFDMEHELREHYNTHSDAERKKFQCDKCSASFFKKQILSRHLASHGEKVVRKECRRCGAQFSSKIEYQKHLISHSSGRVCKYCSKILSTSANRKRHEALHLGLKPYRCTHCGMCFAQSKDLDRHLRKQHSDVCFFCDLCNKLFPSQASLDVHLHDKHSDSSPTKKVEKSPSPELIDNVAVSKPDTEPDNRPIKLKVCNVCKRTFPTFYAMMKHRTQAHPYYTKRRKNRKTVKQKMAQQASAKDGFKVRKPYGKNNKHNNLSNSTVRRGRPPLDRSVKFGTPTYRPGSRWITRRFREQAKKEEIEFYFTLSDKIAENLLHFVDGKTSQLSLKAFNFNEQHCRPWDFEERGRFPWSNYNFPTGYDVDQALITRGLEVKNNLPENLSSRDRCLYATGLNSVKKLSQMAQNVAHNQLAESSSNFSETFRIQLNGIDIKKLNLEERKKLIGRKVQTVVLCYVCMENFESNKAFEIHCLNNHPNVVCSCIEIEGNKDEAPVIPVDLRKQNISADGVFFSWNVPPPLSESSLLKCTKCKSNFKTSLDLHAHVIECGDLKLCPMHVWKFSKQKRIKRTMKYRMSLAQQEATFSCSKACKTPEKDLYSQKESMAKSQEKMAAKSTEKSQFYKSGRLQTTSFTVDMNYFKTKPVKPPNTQPSKRGRKSYASLSYRYKNASMQSTSVQCKEVFTSQSALNVHLQNHVLPVSDTNAAILPSLSSLSKSVSTGVPQLSFGLESSSSGKSKNSLVSHKPEIISDKLQLPSIKNTGVFLPGSKVVENLAKEFSNCSKTNHRDSFQSNVIENPIDLSKNSKDVTSVSISKVQHNYFSAKTSALEVAMAAIQEFSHNSEQNEHISKLQKTVEKLTPPSRKELPQERSGSSKRVGRPKKVKRLGSVKFRRNLFPEPIPSSEETISKPLSKLEETVKRLTGSKNDTATVVKITSPLSIDASKINIPDKICKATAIQPVHAPIKIIVSKNIVKFPASLSCNTISSIASNARSNFVPILMCNDSTKSVDSVQVTACTNVDNKSSNQNTSKNLNISSVSTGEQDDSKPSFKQQSSPHITVKCTEDMGASSSSSISNSISPNKKGDEAPHASGSQGRISPSLESIVNSIKQKLHSQESSPNDDVALSWLEDEKFEIPSRSQLVPANSKSNSPSAMENEPFLLSADSSVPRDCNDSVLLNIPTESLISDSVESIHDHTQKEKAVDSIPNIVSNTNEDEKSEGNAAVTLISENLFENVNEKDISSSEVAETKNDQSVVKSKPVHATRIKYRKKRRELFTVRKNKSLKKFTPSQNSIPKKPGRPKRKDILNSSSLDSDFIKCINTLDSSQSKAELKDDNLDQVNSTSLPSEEMSSTLTKTDDQINEQSIANVFKHVKEIGISELQLDPIADNIVEAKNLSQSKLGLTLDNVVKQNDFSQLELNPSLEPSSTASLEMGEPHKLPSPSPTNTDSIQMEDGMSDSKLSNLRAFRTKAKPGPPVSETNPSVETDITTEFGKSLASRMKEKMRLSFENASLENLIRSDDGNNTDRTPDPSLSDTNSQISDDDSEYLRAIKKEIESAEPLKKHSCPFCKLEFAYLTNFRRHLKICRSRLLTKEIEPIQSTSTSVLQYLPKKDEVEHSMLNLLRHQSRQTQMLKEADNTIGNKIDKFRTYNCNVCHRIYLSLFKLLQHQVTHKLNTLESNADLDYAKDIESYSNSELEESNLHESEISKEIDQSHSDILLPTETEKSFPDKKMNTFSAEEHVDLAKQQKVELIESTPIENNENMFSANPESQNQFISTDCNAAKNSESIIKIEQPIKRKRGRPVGWRKYTTTSDSAIKPVVRTFQIYNKTKSMLMGIKKKVVQTGAFKRRKRKLFFTRHKQRINRTASKHKNKLISLSQFEFTAEDDLPPNHTVDKIIESKSSINSDLKKEKPMLKYNQKNPFKGSYKKTISSISNTIEDVISMLPKSPPKNAVKHSTSINSPKSSLNQEKRFRNRPPFSEERETNLIGLEPPKRKPGRPPKNLQAIPSTSKSRGSFQSSNFRNFHKMVSRSNVVNSSDSDDDNEESEDLNIKKKIAHLKPCPICKEKFSATLILHRHIQLVHKRRSNYDVVKMDTPNISKVNKKSNIRSAVNNSSGDESKVLSKISQKSASKSELNNLKESKSTDVFKKSNSKTVIKSNISNLISPKSIDTFEKKSINDQLCSNVRNAISVKNIRAKSISPKRHSAEKSKAFKSPKIKCKLSDDQNSANALKISKKVLANLSTKDVPEAHNTPILKKSKNYSTNNQPALEKKLVQSATSDNAVNPKVTNFKKAVTKTYTKTFSSKLSDRVVKTGVDCSSGTDSTKRENKIGIDTSRQKVLRKMASKLHISSNSDSDSLNDFKQIRSAVQKSKFVKALSTKSVVASHAETNQTKMKKNVFKTNVNFRRIKKETLTADNTDIDNIAVINKANINAGTKKVNIKKESEMSVTEDSSDVDSIKIFKETGVNSSAKKFPRIKQETIKSTTENSSDVQSTKISKNVGIKNGIKTQKTAKKIRSTTLFEDCYSDSDSIMSTKTVPRSLKRIIGSYSSDSESVKRFRTSTKTRSTYNSDTESSVVTKKSFAKSSLDNSDCDSDFSIKTDATPLKNLKICYICKEIFTNTLRLRSHMKLVHNCFSESGLPKKAVTTKRKFANCPICKNKFVTKSALYQHMQFSHSRKSDPGKMISIETIKTSPKSRAMVKILDDAVTRSALSRQCRKPLPPLKRKWSKKELPSPDEKK